MENLLTPDYLRRVAWRPPADVSLESVAAELRSLGAREWQISFAAPILTEACLNPAPLPGKESKGKEVQASKDALPSGNAG